MLQAKERESSAGWKEEALRGSGMVGMRWPARLYNLLVPGGGLRNTYSVPTVLRATQVALSAEQEAGEESKPQLKESWII